jgi:DICT domain-containing protein
MTNPPAQAEPITVASVGLARLIAQAAQRFPQWSEAAIAESCVRLRNDGVPLAPDIAFHASARLMLQMSHAIEDTIIRRRLPCELYVGFQRLSLMNTQASRYADILACAQFIYAYGLDDAPLANDLLQYTRTLLRFVVQPRHGSDLLWFWFLVVDDPSFQTALLAQQDSGYLWNRSLAGRSYQGFWSFDPHVVRQIVPTLRNVARVLYYT